MDRGLWAECPPCATEAPYSGIAEWYGERLFGLFDCPVCAARFPVWRPEFDERLAGDAVGAPG